MHAFHSRLRHALPKTVVTQLNDKIRLFSTWSILFIVLLSCNQTAIFASTEHNQDSFTLAISPNYSVKISPKMQQLDQRRINHRHHNRYRTRTRYEIRLFNHHTDEQHSAFIRPTFGKITEVLLHNGIITVFMEGTIQQKRYIVLDHYQMIKQATAAINTATRLHHTNSALSQNLPSYFDEQIPSVYLKHLQRLSKTSEDAALLSTMQVIHNTQQFPKGLPHASGFTVLNPR